MKILKIIHGYPPLYQAGSEVYSQSLVNELLRQGHEVRVFTREENPFAPDFSIRENGILTVVNLPREKDGYRHASLDNKFSDVVKSFHPDVAHVGHLNHLSTGIVEVLKAAGVPVVFTLHDFWLMCPRGQFLQTNFGQNEYYRLCDGQEHGKCARECYRSFWNESENDPESEAYWTRWVERRMAETRRVTELTDVFLAPSRRLRERFIRDFGVREDKIVYMDYGFPSEYLSPPEVEHERERFTFGYIGTHIPAKGVSMLIEAYARLNGRSELWVWGREAAQSTAALKRMADGKNVRFMGEYVNKNIAAEVMSRVDCIVVPSIWQENSPLVIHEAQICGKPVITADFGGMAEYVEHGVNGLLFRHRDREDLYRKMRYAVENPDLMRQMGKRGYLYDPKALDVSEHVKEIVKIYQKLLQK